MSRSASRARPVYKICPAAAWQQAVAEGWYRGSPDDRRDGFIHLSTAAQLAGTARRHFTGQADLMLIALDASRLGQALVWERSRTGDLFPHLYEPLDVRTATRTWPMPLGPDGVPAIPPDVA